MPRKPRYAPPGAIHHVTNRANRRKTLFFKSGDYKAFIALLFEACARKNVRLIAFCLMANHFHLIVWPREGASLSAFMHWLTSPHVRRYHAHHGLVGTGHLYQERFRNRVITTDEKLVIAVRYVEANPLKAKCVDRAEKWEWSSLRLRAEGDPEGLLCECPVPLPSDWSTYVDQTTFEAMPADERSDTGNRIILAG